MTKLLWPHKRQELIAFLSDLIDTGTSPSKSLGFDIDSLVHFFFDDTDLASSPDDEIGRIVYLDELHFLHAFTAHLDKMINNIGDMNTAAYISSPDWKVAISEATKLRKLLLSNN